MCAFISAVEKDGDVIFLTGDDLRSKRGLEMIAAIGKEDVAGHGAVRWFYNFEGGVNREYTDFSNPKNFPERIASAIKDGRMAHALFGEFPEGLLTDTLYGDYEAKRQPLEEDYEAKRRAQYEDYLAKLRFLDADPWGYRVERSTSDEDYGAKRRALYRDYWAKRRVQYEEAWMLFSNAENRKEVWR